MRQSHDILEEERKRETSLDKCMVKTGNRKDSEKKSLL